MLLNMVTARRAIAALLPLLVAHAGQAAERGPKLQAAATTAADEASSARVIVKYKAGTALGESGSAGPRHAAKLSQRLGFALTDGRAMGTRRQLLIGGGVGAEALAARLATQPDIEYAVVDRRAHAQAVVPDDPLYLNTAAVQTPTAGQWYLRAPTSTFVSAIDAPAAWSVSTGSASVVVAVLDTGIRADHPDLSGKTVAGYDFVSNTAAANDGDGRDSDPSDPGDWITSAENASGTFAGCGAADSSWHGTQTAGLIGAATDNALGMASVGRDVMLLPVRVLGKCGGYDSDIIDAMRWAAGLTVSGMTVNPHPARIINLSLGASGSCGSAYQEVVNELAAAGVTVVASAGNDGLAVAAPANCTGVVAVAGVRHSGTKVGYSSLGPQVKVSAPAGNCVNSTGTCLYPILTTSNTGTTTPSAASYTSGGDDASLGTSFSAPLVSGTAALMLSANPSLTPASVIALLQQTARAFPSSGAGSGVSACKAPSATAQTSECYCTTTTCGAGLLDAGAAVAAAQNAAQPTASIQLSASSVTAGNAVTLDGSGSSATGSANVAGYAWSVVDGSSLASITAGATAAQATLTTVAAGDVTVQLNVTDSNGLTATATATVTVTAAGTSGGNATTASSSGSGGDGGGALDGWMVAALAATLFGLWSRRRQRP